MGKTGSDPCRETGVIVDIIRHAPREGSDPVFPIAPVLWWSMSILSV
jgi:hypothetical protein